METSIGVFTSTFAEMEDVDAEVDEIFTLLGMFNVMRTAPLWNKCKTLIALFPFLERQLTTVIGLKELAFFKESSASNWLSVASNKVNHLVSNGVTLIKSTSVW
jgi:hypothetical protein